MGLVALLLWAGALHVTCVGRWLYMSSLAGEVLADDGVAPDRYRLCPSAAMWWMVRKRWRWGWSGVGVIVAVGASGITVDQQLKTSNRRSSCDGPAQERLLQ
ncbi:hypothetical protein Vretifemale_4875 [Volvox reticuliferus]|uniref:Secreted protein n=1 Tax=Volvox reticuliferus TaxID=1737510 RepID=A0A8J4C5G2_9CHLO|nr:hypothetical protein Vretifemale_4875 [Volvox reticuliferus]